MWLKEAGYEVIIAYYEPYSLSPQASVPLHKIASIFSSSQPKIIPSEFEACEAFGIGCYFPEFEFTHYWRSKRWDQLIEDCDYHLCVSGSNMAALGFTQHKKPFMAWLASPWQDDRKDRVNQFGWLRRIADNLIVTPICQILEKRILRSGIFLPVSRYSQEAIIRNGASSDTQVFHVPIDADYFCPSPSRKDQQTKTRTIGFVGRFEDPRKNIALLIQAFKVCLVSEPNLRLLLIGDELSKETSQLIVQEGLESKVEVRYKLSSSELLTAIRELSVFVVPSFQEGLCIAALEAMRVALKILFSMKIMVFLLILT